LHICWKSRVSRRFNINRFYFFIIACYFYRAYRNYSIANGEVLKYITGAVWTDCPCSFTNPDFKKLIYEENINGLDRKLILVSPSHTGNFTIIEGNKRAVALLSMNKLVGNQIYLGISKQILRYLWARYSK